MTRRYRVAWSRHAMEQDIAALTVAAMQRGEPWGAITEATDRIERKLAVDPIGRTESRVPPERIYIDPPLSVYYVIHEPKQMVVILRVIGHGAT